MPWNLLILPLVGGYYFLSRSNYFKFKQQRLEKERLIFDSILVGIIILLITFFLRYIIDIIFPSFIIRFYKYIPLHIPFIGTTFCSFFLAVLITEIGNITFFKNYKLQIEKAIKKVGNELELILRSSFKDSILLQFTLDTDKFYIAWVKELPIPTVSNYIRVIPVFSGYRDSEKKMIFTTHYLKVYSRYIDEESFESLDELNIDLIITLDNVVTVSYFDINMYEKFNEKTENNNKPYIHNTNL